MPEAVKEEVVEIQARVTRVVYRHPSSLWKIVEIRKDGVNSSAMGELFENDLGESLTFRGQWKAGRGEFGEAFHFESAVRPIPTSTAQIEGFLKKTKGVGDVTAKKIMAAFGSDFREVIEKNPESIRQKVKISQKLLSAIRENWFDRVELRDLQMVLGTGGINSERTARKVLRVLGKRAAEIVDQNPYRLTKVQGIGFKTADEMALKKGWSTDDVRRVDAAVAHVLEEAAKSGHSYLNQAEVIEAVQKLASVKVNGNDQPYPATEAQAAIDRASERLEIIRETLTINGNVSYLCYLPENYHYEVEAAERIAALQSYHHEEPKNLDAKLKKVESEEQITLSQEQRLAVIDALKYNLSILTGKPGTGKSTSTKALIHVAEEIGLNVALVAPTGRAAKRMSEITGREASTIHRLLLSNQDGEFFQFNEDNPLPHDLVIVDESSMLDLRLLVFILRALKPTCSLVFIGDEHQLPSIGAGTVLKDLIASKRINTVVLSKIFRQAEGSLIIQNAHRIHRGDMPQFPQPGDKAGDSFLIDVPKGTSKYSGKAVDDSDFVKEKLKAVYARLANLGYDLVRDVQILIPMKGGPCGYNEINQVAQQIVNPHGQNIEVGDNLFRVGDRIMQIKNDYDLNVYNGDCGVIREVIEEGDKAGDLVIQWSDRTMEYPSSESKNLRMAYATTIHRFQGSECPVVILILTSHHHIMLDRNLIYTANTRAKKLLVYLASRQAIHTAVETQRVLSRNSLLSQRIRMQLRTDKKDSQSTGKAVQTAIA